MIRSKNLPSLVLLFSFGALVMAVAAYAAPPFPEASVLSIAELAIANPEIYHQLDDLGYPGRPETLSLVVTKTPTLAFEVRETAERGEPPSTRKNLWVAGIVLTRAYFNDQFVKGVEFSYLHFNPRRRKVIYHADASLSGDRALSVIALSFDPHVGKWGLFFDVNVSRYRYETPLLEGAPVTIIPALGGGLGWQRGWGPDRRIVTSLKVGAIVNQDLLRTDLYHLQPEARLKVGWELSSRKVQR